MMNILSALFDIINWKSRFPRPGMLFFSGNLIVDAAGASNISALT